MRQVILACVLVGILAWLPTTTLAGQNDTAEQRQVVAQYLQAYLRSDMRDIARLLPARLEAMFGPYPFVGAVTITQAKVQTNQALLEFTGLARDPQFPHKGGVLLYRRHSNWFVRQILFYDHIPMVFNLPARSVNAADRAQEPRVRAIGSTFLAAWERGDLSRESAHWFDWPHANREPIKGLSCSDLTLTRTYSAWHDPYIHYTVKVTYQFGILSYSMQMKGSLLLVNEEQGWKVRGNVMAFDF